MESFCISTPPEEVRGASIITKKGLAVSGILITGVDKKVSLSLTNTVMFGPGRVEHRLRSSSRVLVNLQELDPGVSRDVLAAYL